MKSKQLSSSARRLRAIYRKRDKRGFNSKAWMNTMTLQLVVDVAVCNRRSAHVLSISPPLPLSAEREESPSFERAGRHPGRER